MKKFQYICLHHTDNGYKVDEFTLFADIVSETDDTITYKRYIKFGLIESSKTVTISKKEFYQFYEKMTDEYYQRCLRGIEERKLEVK